MNIDEKVCALNIQDKFNLLRIKKVYKDKVPEYLKPGDGVDLTIINPQKDVNDYYNQPLVVMSISDYLAQLQTFELNIKPVRKLKSDNKG